MMNEGLSIADAMALATKGDNDSFGYGGTWIWVFFLFFLLAWGGNGFGFGGGANNAATQGAITRADLFEGFNYNDLARQVQGTQQGLADGFYAVNTSILEGLNGVGSAVAQNGYQTQLGLAGVNSEIAQNRYDTQLGLTQLGYSNQAGMQNITEQIMQNRFDNQVGLQGVGEQITQSRFDNQMASCQTNHNIDAVRYDNAQNTAAIVNALHAENEQTRALINANEMQNLRDRLEDKDRQLQAANFQISQQAQTSSIVEQLQPMPKPAYMVSSPYSTYPYGCGCAN